MPPTADLDTARMAIEAATEVLAGALECEEIEQVATAMHEVAGQLLKRAEKAEAVCRAVHDFDGTTRAMGGPHLPRQVTEALDAWKDEG